MGERSQFPTIFVWMLICDVIVIVAATALVARNLLALYPSVAIGMPVLFVVNLFFARRAIRRKRISSDEPDQLRAVLKKLWILAALFTTFGVITIVSCIRRRYLDTAFPGLLGLLIPGYLWFFDISGKQGPEEQRSATP